MIVKTPRNSLNVQRLTIEAKFPSLNEIIALSKSHWSKYKRLKHDWTILISACAKGLHPMPTPVKIRFHWYGNMRVDPDNISSAGRKLILDSIVAAGVIPNDTFKHILSFSDKFYKSKITKVEVILINRWVEELRI